MGLENDGVEALDRSLLLQAAVVRERLAEDLKSLRLTAPHRRSPPDEQSSIRHWPSSRLAVGPTLLTTTADLNPPAVVAFARPSPARRSVRKPTVAFGQRADVAIRASASHCLARGECALVRPRRFWPISRLR